MPSLQIVIAANGEKTLKSLAKAYLNFYRGKLDCSIYIYDSKYTEEMHKSLKTINCVEYVDEPKGPLEKYFRHAKRIQGEIEMPDLIIRGTADDIFLYTAEEARVLVDDPNKYIRQESILNFESIKIGDKVALKGQILNNRTTVDLKETNGTSEDKTRCIEMNYYGIHSTKMFIYAIYWQISLIRTLPEEWYHLSEILLSIPFRSCVGIWSKDSCYINQRSPVGRVWGKKIPGMKIASNLKKMDQKVDIRYIYENYLKTMQNKFEPKERIPELSEEWLRDISDLRNSKLIHDIHRSNSAWQRLGYYAFELLCNDIDNDNGKTYVTAERGNKCNLKILFNLNQEFVQYCTQNLYFTS